MSRAPLVLALLAACAHRAEPPRPVRERAAAMNPATLPDTPLRGDLDGRPFALRAAWLRVVRRAGQARVDLVLSEGRPSRLCAQPTPADARQVVVRLPGVTRLPVGTLRVEPAGTPEEVFAESPHGHGVTGARGAALVVVTRADDARAEGKLRVCLADAHGSCLAGSFAADACWDELDLDGPRGARDRRADGGGI
ncbi:MAG: hypothetical protein U0325_31145 [Polyangiales bacterium]